MKAIALIKTGNAVTAFEVREIAKPQPQKGEVLIKVDAFALPGIFINVRVHR